MADKVKVEAKINCPNCGHPITVRSFFNSLNGKFEKTKNTNKTFQDYIDEILMPMLKKWKM